MASCPEKPRSYESKRCNVLVVGETGSGKSTLANQILCHPCFGASKSRTVRSRERAIKFPNNVYYSIKIIDTMGFLDSHIKPMDILMKIKEYFKKHVVEGVNLVLFVMSNRCLTTGEIQTIEMIMKNLRGTSCISALVITHCEKLKREIRDELEQKFHTSERTSTVAGFMKKGVYTVGFPDLTLVAERVRPFYERAMKADVQKLHTLVYESTEMHLMSKMFGHDQSLNEHMEMATCPPEVPYTYHTELYYPCSYECKRCNVVVLGQTGSGKSEVANKILRYKAFRIDSMTVFARVTDVVSCQERAIVSPENIVYSVKVVDTPGFSDPLEDDNVKMCKIRKFFQEKAVEGVSLVLLVMKLEFPTDETMKMVELLQKCFRDTSSITALVLTNCEDLNDKVRKDQVRQFSTGENTLRIAAFTKKGIYTVGFPDLETMDEEMASIYEEDMEKDVQKLHTLIYNSTTMHSTSEMFFDDRFWKEVNSEVLGAASDSSKCNIM